MFQAYCTSMQFTHVFLKTLSLIIRTKQLDSVYVSDLINKQSFYFSSEWVLLLYFIDELVASALLSVPPPVCSCLTKVMGMSKINQSINLWWVNFARYHHHSLFLPQSSHIRKKYLLCPGIPDGHTYLADNRNISSTVMTPTPTDCTYRLLIQAK